MNDQDIIKLVDQRLRLERKRFRSVGTVVSRDTTGPKCMVLFDGATVATPAKVSGTTFVQPGDRCFLDLYGTDWIVTNSYSQTAFGEANKAVDALGSATGAQTSASFQDLNEFGTLTFNKIFDLTFVRVAVSCGAFATGTMPVRVQWAVRFTPVTGGAGYTPADLSFSGININTASTHVTYSSWRRVTNVPSGSYTVSLRWRRAAGSGSAFADTVDAFAVELDERVRAATPIL